MFLTNKDFFSIDDEKQFDYVAIESNSYQNLVKGVKGKLNVTYNCIDIYNFGYFFEFVDSILNFFPNFKVRNIVIL